MSLSQSAIIFGLRKKTRAKDKLINKLQKKKARLEGQLDKALDVISILAKKSKSSRKGAILLNDGGENPQNLATLQPQGQQNLSEEQVQAEFTFQAGTRSSSDRILRSIQNGYNKILSNQEVLKVQNNFIAQQNFKILDLLSKDGLGLGHAAGGLKHPGVGGLAVGQGQQGGDLTKPGSGLCKVPGGVSQPAGGLADLGKVADNSKDGGLVGMGASLAKLAESSVGGGQVGVEKLD